MNNLREPELKVTDEILNWRSDIGTTTLIRLNLFSLIQKHETLKRSSMSHFTHQNVRRAERTIVLRPSETRQIKLVNVNATLRRGAETILCVEAELRLQRGRFCTDRDERGWKRVKESRNVKKVEKVIFLKKKHFCLQVFLGGSTGNRSSVSSFFWNVVLHPFCSHGASTRTFVETTNIWFVVFVWFPLTLRFYTMTALPVNPSTRWTCTAHPAATISCCNSWNADFFLFVKYKVSELL